MAYVYKHIRLDTNEVFYIGIGIRENYRRAKTTARRNSFWLNVVNKAEWKFEIVVDNISFDEAKIREIELIKFYGRKDKGEGSLVNLTDGGDATSGYIVTDAVKKRLSEINKGKTLSDEHKKKISASNMGQKFTDKAIYKMRIAKLGTKQSKETIDKRRQKLFGNKSNTGRKLPEEQRLKMKQSQINRRLTESIYKGKIL
jgi:hypothetical protein